MLALLGDFDRPLTGLELQDGLYDVATALEQAARRPTPPRSRTAGPPSGRATISRRISTQPFSLADLEAVTGHARWQLSRDFRAMFGTSPYRYLVMRRLDRARGMLLAGQGIAETAFGSGFADQSHFSRMFKRAFGLTPNLWRGGGAGFARSFKTGLGDAA